MRIIRFVPALIIVILLIVAVSCNKKSNYNPVPLTGYYQPLQVGKYIIYRLDSMTFYYYGELDTITSYLAKDSVEAAITDGEGRPSWGVVRYLSDTTGTQPWTPNETYMVTATNPTLEVVEDNLRFIKLAFPVDNGYTWTGNTYLPYNPYQDYFTYSDQSHLDWSGWNYTYQNVNTPFTVNGQTYNNTVTVMQINDSINVPITIDTAFASQTLWTETYAEGIGLIYRNTQMWEYQPPTPNGSQLGYKLGFGMTLKIVSHN